MADDELDDLQRERQEAQALAARTAAGTAAIKRKIAREYRPRWQRLDARRIHNSFGKEFDLSMIPKGAA